MEPSSQATSAAQDEREWELADEELDRSPATHCYCYGFTGRLLSDS